MLILKVFSILITAVAGLLQIGLEYKWHDKSSIKHKTVRKILIFIIIIGMLSTVMLVIYDDQQSEIQIQALTLLNETTEKSARESELRETKAIEDRERIKAELENLQSQIKPIISLATEKYPNLHTDMAIKKLSEDIKNLQKEQVELKKKTESRHLSVNQRKTLTLGLKDVPEELKSIYICSTAFDQEAKSYKNDFMIVLQESGFKVKSGPCLQGGIGIRILTKSYTKPIAVSILSNALSKAGIKFTMGSIEEAGTRMLKKVGPFPLLYIGQK